MRSKTLIAAIVMTSMALASPAALAQAPANPSGSPADRPLMTTPQPEDRPTTDPVIPTPGVSGEAPSRELTGQRDPLMPGVPGTTPQAEDAPSEITGEGEAQSDRANPPPATGTIPVPPQR